MITTHYNNSTKILEVTFTGDITVQEMKNYIVSLRENKDLPSKLRILSDASKAKFAERVSKNDLIDFLNENKKTLSRMEYVYDAYVITGTFETALGVLYKTLNTIKNYSFNVFSTKEAAYNWLSIKGD